MLVDVIPVLEVPVAVVDVVDMVAVLDRLAPVVVGVGRTVIGVDLGLRMTFAVVDVVDVVAVYDRLVAVSREVLVIAGFVVLG